LGIKIPLINHGRNRFQFIDVCDVVEAIIMVIGYGIEVEVNIGSNDSPMMRDIIQHLISISGSAATFVNIPKSIMIIFRTLSIFRILPFAPYQLRMYGEDFYFDAREYDKMIPWSPKVTTAESVKG
jgi:nucleoside-diphosphate-sugar epimerase